MTDALEMGGSPRVLRGRSGRAGDRGGADTLLMPADPEAAIRAVVGAVEDGGRRAGGSRRAWSKLLAAKERLGLDRERTVDLEADRGHLDCRKPTNGKCRPR